MENTDTVNLLKECNLGTKMAVLSIDEILEKTSDAKLKELLQKSKEQHEALGNELHSLLDQHNLSDKEPSPMAKSMSWLKTNMKLGMEEGDASIADLMTDGCHMGVKSLHKYKNQYKNADKRTKELCNKLIQIEEDLCSQLTKYL